MSQFAFEDYPDHLPLYVEGSDGVLEPFHDVVDPAPGPEAVALDSVSIAQLNERMIHALDSLNEPFGEILRSGVGLAESHLSMDEKVIRELRSRIDPITGNL